MTESTRMIRIFVIEDHPYLQEMLAYYLGSEPEMEVCGMATTAEAALQEIGRLEPDLLLVDVSLPGMSGLLLVTEVRERWPDLPCLMLSAHGETTHVQRALEEGARGYVLKGHPDELAGAIRKITAGETYISAALRHPPVDRKPSPTKSP